MSEIGDGGPNLRGVVESFTHRYQKLPIPNTSEATHDTKNRFIHTENLKTYITGSPETPPHISQEQTLVEQFKKGQGETAVAQAYLGVRGSLESENKIAQKTARALAQTKGKEAHLIVYSMGAMGMMKIAQALEKMGIELNDLNIASLRFISPMVFNS